MFDLLHRVLESIPADYAEIRHQHRISRGVQVDNGKLEASGAGDTAGVGIRVLKEGSWGFASTTKTDEESLQKAAKDAFSLATTSRNSKTRRIKIATQATVKASKEATAKKRVRDADFEELTSMVMEAHKRINAVSKNTVSDLVSLNLLEDEKYYLNSENSEIHILDSKIFGRISCTSREGSTVAPAFESEGATCGLELFDEHPLVDLAEKTADRAERLLKARMPPGGEATVVLHPGIVGMLAHEAIGHLAEADFIESGSTLAGKIGQQVSSERITLFDDGLLTRGLGWTPYDDEGIPGERTILIDHGILRSYLHSRETAKSFQTKPTGNARAWNFEYDPIIRMRNTCIASGNHDPEEIIRDTKDGYLLIGGTSGQADSNGEFMFGVQEARHISNGSLQETLRGVTISGNVFKTLQTVDAVGKDFEVQAGTCGKEQPVWVGIGGPHLRMKALLGGMPA